MCANKDPKCQVDANSSVRVVIPDDESLLIDVTQLALKEALYVVHNGTRFILCSIIPPGCNRLGTNERRPPSARPSQALSSPGGMQ